MKSISWVTNHEAPEIFLSSSEECLEVDNFGTTIIAGMTECGKTNLVKQIQGIRSCCAALFHLDIQQQGGLLSTLPAPLATEPLDSSSLLG